MAMLPKVGFNCGGCGVARDPVVSLTSAAMDSSSFPAIPIAKWLAYGTAKLWAVA